LALVQGEPGPTEHSRRSDREIIPISAASNPLPAPQTADVQRKRASAQETRWRQPAAGSPLKRPPAVLWVASGHLVTAPAPGSAPGAGGPPRLSSGATRPRRGATRPRLPAAGPRGPGGGSGKRARRSPAGPQGL